MYLPKEPQFKRDPNILYMAQLFNHDPGDLCKNEDTVGLQDYKCMIYGILVMVCNVIVLCYFTEVKYRSTSSTIPA